MDARYGHPISTQWEVPEADTYVLAFVPLTNGAHGTWYIAMRSRDGSWSDDSRDCETIPTPSHWMPLPPDPPETLVLKENHQSTAFDFANIEATNVDSLQRTLEWAAANKLEMVRAALHKEGYHVS